ncbi:MAG: arsenite methyltransferase [Bacteroidia bacterium]|nr:arsenite methyltransferase [Bacteroidia bacterium]
MENPEMLKEMVRQKYSEIAGQSKDANQSSCCGSGGCSTEVYNIMTDNYEGLEGYHSEADLGLGCGLPTQFAQIKPGDLVVDLGSGAGNDVFVARNQVGQDGRVIGIDFTPAMIDKAWENADKLGYRNVEFRLGDIEDIPLASNRADVVVSNCVLNLVPNKEKVFQEMFRILKPGGHFSISDVVLVGDLPKSLESDMEMYAGCVSGAISKEKYLNFIQAAGFENVRIQKEKEINIPTDILEKYLSKEEMKELQKSKNGIFSISVYGEKPKPCGCGPSCC